MRLRRGLSTLEAMVAVTVLAVALTPLLEIQAQIARTHARYQTLYERTTMQRNALTLLRDLNPMLVPEGEIDMGDGAVLEWRARPLTQQIRSTAYSSGNGPFYVALYSVNARVRRATPALDATFEFERVGWRRLDDINAQTRFGVTDPNEFIP